MVGSMVVLLKLAKRETSQWCNLYMLLSATDPSIYPHSPRGRFAPDFPCRSVQGSLQLTPWHAPTGGSPAAAAGAVLRDSELSHWWLVPLEAIELAGQESNC